MDRDYTGMESAKNPVPLPPAPTVPGGSFQELIRALQPDTNNLVILMVGAIVVYALYMLGKDATRLADTALGGLLGFLGSSMKKG